MPLVNPSVLTASALAAMLVLAGCSASADPAPTATEGPLDAYLDEVYRLPSDTDASQLNARVEELTATCMAAQGFEYVAAPPAADDAQPEVAWLPDDPDWVAQYGYGIVRSPYSGEAAVSTPADDPNNAYVETLGEGERDAYWRTLYGDTDVDPEDGGCYGDAYDEVSGDDPGQLDANQPVMDAISAFYQSLPDAPEMAEVDADWSSCMGASGHDFAHQPDAQASIADAVNAVYTATPDATADDPALATLAADELALAGDDLRCRESTDYTARAAEVQRSLQQRFVDDHRADLDALVADAQRLRG